VEGLRRFHDLATVNCSIPSQEVCVKAFSKIGALRRRAFGTFERNFPLLDRWVSETDDLEWIPPEGVLFGFPRLTGGQSSGDLFDLLRREYETIISPGRFFDGMDDHFRIGFTMDAETLIEGLARIAEAIHRV
jgi:aspartate/methionine/tyrosine aminotransferase